MEVERTEAQHKQWQESQSQGMQAQSSCEKNKEKTEDNKQLSEMVSSALDQFLSWPFVQFVQLDFFLFNFLEKIS